MAQKKQKLQTSAPGSWETPPPDFSFILFERVEPEENANRFYYLGWMPTLLHRSAVVRMYGRKGETQHMVTPQPFDSLEAAWPLLRSIIKARLRHGYHVVMPEVYRRRN
jgi:predicted DNA-binding WGR domain protein